MAMPSKGTYGRPRSNGCWPSGSMLSASPSPESQPMHQAWAWATRHTTYCWSMPMVRPRCSQAILT